MCRVFILCAFITTLSGCEFRSLYGGTGETVVKNLKAIKIESIQNRKGQLLRNRLLALLTPTGVSSDPQYILSVTLKTQEQRIGILRDATTSRVEKIITASYTLKDIKTSKVMVDAKVSSIGAYNVLTGADYSTIVSKKKAESLALEDIAMQIQSQLACYFEGQEKLLVPSHL